MANQDVAAAVDTASPLPGGSERILVVDDDPKIVEMIAHMLASLGYHPMIDTNSVHALEEFELMPKRYDGVVLDQKMPGMTGDILAEKMLGLRPGLPIILCTAFSDTLPKERLDAVGIKHLIMKPIVMKELAEHLRKALDGNKTA
jgi:CheY-like chemotaxis protein